MSKPLEILIAGIGGQGIQFAGDAMAYAGFYDDKNVSCSSSYGAEKRGGISNCSICISDEPIGSPLVTHPNVFVVMSDMYNSVEQYIDRVPAGGKVFINSSVVDKKISRTDIDVFYVPTNEIAEKSGNKKGGNIILIGKIFKETKFSTEEALKKAMEKLCSGKKAAILDSNLEALKIGMQL